MWPITGKALRTQNDQKLQISHYYPITSSEHQDSLNKKVWNNYILKDHRVYMNIIYRGRYFMVYRQEYFNYPEHMLFNKFLIDKMENKNLPDIFIVEFDPEYLNDDVIIHTGQFINILEKFQSYFMETIHSNNKEEEYYFNPSKFLQTMKILFEHRQKFQSHPLENWYNSWEINQSIEKIPVLKQIEDIAKFGQSIKHYYRKALSRMHWFRTIYTLEQFEKEFVQDEMPINDTYYYKIPVLTHTREAALAVINSKIVQRQKLKQENEEECQLEFITPNFILSYKPKESSSSKKIQYDLFYL